MQNDLGNVECSNCCDDCIALPDLLVVTFSGIALCAGCIQSFFDAGTTLAYTGASFNGAFTLNKVRSNLWTLDLPAYILITSYAFSDCSGSPTGSFTEDFQIQVTCNNGFWQAQIVDTGGAVADPFTGTSPRLGSPSVNTAAPCSGFGNIVATGGSATLP